MTSIALDPPANEPTRREGFFAYHGIWAPGVRVLRNMTLRAKAALVISCDTLVGNAGSCNFFISNFMYPLMLIALGILLCIFVSMLSTHCMDVNQQDKVEYSLKMQLIISSILLLGIIFLAALLTYPSGFEMRLLNKTISNRTVLHPYLCSILGLISGLIIAIFT